MEKFIVFSFFLIIFIFFMLLGLITFKSSFLFLYIISFIILSLFIYLYYLKITYFQKKYNINKNEELYFEFEDIKQNINKEECIVIEKHINKKIDYNITNLEYVKKIDLIDNFEE